MFGKNEPKRSVQVSIVKNKRKNDNPGEDRLLSPETVAIIADRSKEVAKYIAITAVAAYAAVKTIDTLSEIAVKKTKSADNDEK